MKIVAATWKKEKGERGKMENKNTFFLFPFLPFPLFPCYTSPRIRSVVALFERVL
jgi:hypothetical protein